MIRADRLIKRFAGFTAVDEVSFTVERGEVVAFLGPNGAGKSTTMRMLAGCLEPDDGACVARAAAPRGALAPRGAAPVRCFLQYGR